MNQTYRRIKWQIDSVKWKSYIEILVESFQIKRFSINRHIEKNGFLLENKEFSATCMERVWCIFCKFPYFETGTLKCSSLNPDSIPKKISKSLGKNYDDIVWRYIKIQIIGKIQKNAPMCSRLIQALNSPLQQNKTWTWNQSQFSFHHKFCLVMLLWKVGMHLFL